MPCGPVVLASTAFEDIEVGQTASIEYLVDNDHVEIFSRLTGDASPLHTDDAYARRTRFRERIAHGLLVAAPLSTLVGMLLPGRLATLMGVDINFSNPVPPGSRLILRGEVKHKSEATRGLVVAYSIRFTESGREAANGRVRILVETPPHKGLIMSELRELKLAMDFEGKVVLITGASRGIGETTARLFALHGARVALTYFQGQDDARVIADDIRSNGGEALALPLDVRDPAQVAAAVAKTVETFGRLDILVNNAAGDYRAVEFTDTGWNDMADDLDRVVRGAFHCIQAALPHLLAQGGGHIVNVCSQAVSEPVANHCKYITAKAALLGMTRALAVELGPKNIRVNAVSPGLTETDLTSAIPQASKDAAARQIPLGRLADPLDTAKAILFLSSPYADYVSGQDLAVSGGR